ncbi:hypothetical protein J5X84_20975 [Streptosporangiaceae bacterium NEAU-GS5]|nr:hypothetical protein [Streptosporangiaceae bacterium NEAU-GS5]
MSDKRWLDPLGERGDNGPTAKGMYIWVVVCVPAGFELVTEGNPPNALLGWTALITVAALYIATTDRAFAAGPEPRRLLAVLILLCVACSFVFLGNWIYLLILASIATGITIRGPACPPVLFLLALLAVGLMIWVGGGVGAMLSLAWSVFIAGFVPAVIIRLWEAIGELKATRQELARVAVSEERARFSRDLHDLLGHTLSVMVVKAEAVRRLAPRDAAAAAREAADIERIGREALTEVREAVTGYRGRGLTVELDNARRALADAGIGATIRTPILDLPPETDALLGWAVREGVTNVIRHSHATRCEITLDDAGLRITDNGRGDTGGSGHGLSGLRERVQAVGGTLDLAAPSGGGFSLLVTVA